MQAILGSNIGMRGGKPCRVCKWGGTKKWKQEEDGVRAALEPGTPRSAEEALRVLSKQLDYARDDKQTQYYDSRTESGYADAFTHSVAVALLEENDVLRGRAPDHPRTPRPALTEAQVQNRMAASHRAYKSTECHSPLLRLQNKSIPSTSWSNWHVLTSVLLPADLGWDVTQSSPVEVHHTFLLGPVKYVLRATKRNLNSRQLDMLQTHLEALNTDGPPCGSIFRAGYIIKHADSLVGKELKLCAQLFLRRWR
ncbi:hypothetical protein CF326_g5447 [Tilletia indica]|nr:hypothetical protein CF326_g5447 [Tilletia indica]